MLKKEIPNQRKKTQKSKTQAEKDFDDLMKQYSQIVDKKDKMMGRPKKQKRIQKSNSKLHLNDLYESQVNNKDSIKQSDQEPETRISDIYSKDKTYVRQKSILKNGKRKTEKEIVITKKKKKKGLAFLMDGLNDYEELSTVKKVTFLDTKSELDKDINQEEGFVPMFNYDNTAIGKKGKINFADKRKLFQEKPETKVRLNVQDAPKEKSKKNNMKATIKKNKHLKDIEKNLKRPKKRVQAVSKKVKKAPAKVQRRKKPRPQPKPHPQPKPAKEKQKDNTSDSEIIFKYDSVTDSDNSEFSSNQRISAMGSLAIEAQIMNQRNVLNIFKKKNNIGKKSMFRTMDFDKAKEPVSRRDVVKNKQKNINAVRQNKKQNPNNNSKNPFHKLKNVGVKKKENKTTLASMKAKKKTPNKPTRPRPQNKTIKKNKIPIISQIHNNSTPSQTQKTQTKISRNSVTKLAKSEVEKDPKKKITQPWNVTIEDRINLLKDNLDAKAFLVHDSKTDTILISKNAFQRREMASITKVMTCYSLLRFCEENQIILIDEFFEVTPKAANMNGTSAKLMENTFVSIHDLLWGLMLPSGNDAAMCIAENVGRLLRMRTDDLMNFQIYSGYNTPRPDFLEFMDLMNQHAREMGLTHSHFANPHGLNNENNTSNCHDLLNLSLEAMKNSLFRKVVATVEYTGKYFKKKLSNRNKASASKDANVFDHRQITQRQKEMLRSFVELSKKKMSKKSK